MAHLVFKAEVIGATAKAGADALSRAPS